MITGGNRYPLQLIFFIALATGPPKELQVAKRRDNAIAGISVAGCSSFVVITFYGVVAGPIKISLWGLQIEGAGGSVLLWILCVLGLALAARMTWGLKP